MSGTEGLRRGLEVIDTGKPIQFPLEELHWEEFSMCVGEAVDDGEKLVQMC